jgi:hypothetical protein
MTDTTLAEALEPLTQLLVEIRVMLELIEEALGEDYRTEGREIEPGASLRGEQ